MTIDKGFSFGDHFVNSYKVFLCHDLEFCQEKITTGPQFANHVVDMRVTVSVGMTQE